MSIQVPCPSNPSTPGRKANLGKGKIDFYGTNSSTTPAGPPPLSSSSLMTDGPPPNLGSSLISLESPVKPNLFSSQGNNIPDFSLTLTSEDKLNQYESGHSSQRINNSPRDNLEEKEENVLRSRDHEESLDSQQSYNNFKTGKFIHHSDENKKENTNEEDFAGFEPDSGINSSSDLEDIYSGLQPQSANLSSESMDIQMDGIEEKNWSDNSPAGVFKYADIARSMYSSMTLQSVEESDDLILATEALTNKLYNQATSSDSDKEDLEDILFNVSQELIQLWENYYEQTIVYRSEEYTTSIGPGPQAPNFVKANFLASLTLRIRHPRNKFSSLTSREMTLPQTLLEWMEKYHNPYPNQYEEILAHRPSPANHKLFWDTVFNCLIRGKVNSVLNLMKNAGWKYTRDETDILLDAPGRKKMSDITMTNIEWAMETAVQILLKCPATHGDWNSRNNEWRMFRLRALQALEDLKKFNEGRNHELNDNERSMLEPGSFNETAKKARSLIPWHLYQSLVTFYNLVMGDMSTILANSQDWCEATIGLVVWWDECKKDQGLSTNYLQQMSYISNKNSISKFYDHKIRVSFEAATSNSTDFQINSADEVQIALASLFQGDSENVINFLRYWSGPVSCAVAEIGSLAGWLPKAEEKTLINMGGSLDQEDFDVLGITQSSLNSDGIKDKTLITYANNLSKRKDLKSSADPEMKLNSWEISIAIFGRLDSGARTMEIIREFLNNFSLEDSITVNRLCKLLNSLDLNEHAEIAAQRYAEKLEKSSHKYGEALYYYALAHNPKKVRKVLKSLISSSLVQSSAFPPDEGLDYHMRTLIDSPQDALTEISGMDSEAARLLHVFLSGYASLRKFYDLRDEHLMPSDKAKSCVNARKRQASIALLAVITSSSDHIRGGLYDKENNAVVHVKFLLALLGEAMVFVNQTDFILTVPQIQTLLYIIEDFHSVPSFVYTKCTKFLQTVITSRGARKESAPSKSQQQSIINLDRMSNNFPVISPPLASNQRQLVKFSGAPSKNLVERGWDWRDFISTETTGNDLLRLLRLGLAKDLGRAWLMDFDNKF
ncbi:Nucleoporin NUP85 [Golovinomyces cichoracearum]|uniref:Nuclear pore complex protein Nup85 n=1 Tax=Golovinomyces cichoracearum TaxID=62708 RepID=A0A420IDK8_9PEZI|nr:Nucleoporin NUP85 [Golovinomyces cichoracearum]